MSIRRFLINKAYVLKRILLFCYSVVFLKPLNVMSREETIDYLLHNNCSMARLGNGEMDIIIGDNKGFQKYDPNLALELKTLKTDENLLVCVPFLLENKEARNKHSNSFYKRHRKLYLYYWRKFYNHNSVMGDAALTRFYIDHKDKSRDSIINYVNKLKQLWHGRDIVLVEGSLSRLGVGNDLFDNANDIKRILCPPENAYSKIDLIVDTVEKHVVPNTNSLILIALGPTATVLAARLSKLGYQALDVGHVDIEYEWLLKGVKEKVAIGNKYVNEVDEGRISESSIVDEQYNQQIIAKVDL